MYSTAQKIINESMTTLHTKNSIENGGYEFKEPPELAIIFSRVDENLPISLVLTAQLNSVFRPGQG